MVRIAIAFLMGVTISACMANKLFPFRYYSLDAESYEGKLLGPSVDQDLLLSMCRPTDIDSAPCMVMFTSAFLRMKEAYMTCQVDLQAAQRECR